MRARRRNHGRAVLFCLLLAACQSPGETVHFDTPTANGKLSLYGQLFLPKGTNRVPVMIFSHGSSGYMPYKQAGYIAALNDMGVAALSIDHFGPRGIHDTLMDQSQLGTFAMARDEYAALDALAQYPRIDTDRAGVAGFSKGGEAVWEAALSRFVRSRGPTAHHFVLFVAFYPYCGEFYKDLRTTGAPIRFLVGGADDYVGTIQCVELAQRMRAAGGDAEVTVYPGARHAFDQNGPNFLTGVESWQNCFLDEQSDDQWRERSQGVLFRWNDPASVRLATRACTHLGVTTGGNWNAGARALEDLKREVALHLLGKASPAQ